RDARRRDHRAPRPRPRRAGRRLGIVQAARAGARRHRRARRRRRRAGPLTRVPPDRSPPMRAFTDLFIRHPVLAAVVNLVLVLVGWRALTTLPVQQYPQLESSSIVITTVYTGASAETVRGFHADRARGRRDRRG